MTKCIICGNEMEDKNDLIYELHRTGARVLVTNLKGHKCPRCGEVYYCADSVGVIDKVKEKINMPSIVFKRKITKSGSSLNLRLPRALMETMAMKGTEKVSITPLTKKQFIVTIKE